MEQLVALTEGATLRDDLRRWFTPYLVAFPPPRPENEEPTWDPEAGDKAFFWNLVWLFEDDGFTEIEHRELAAKVVQLFRCIPSSATALDVLPLIRREAKLCEAIGKHRAGVISRTGFLSVISENFRFESVRGWLSEATLPSLEELCANLHSGDYLAVEQQLPRPPA